MVRTCLDHVRPTCAHRPFSASVTTWESCAQTLGGRHHQAGAFVSETASQYVDRLAFRAITQGPAKTTERHTVTPPHAPAADVAVYELARRLHRDPDGSMGFPQWDAAGYPPPEVVDRFRELHPPGSLPPFVRPPAPASASGPGTPPGISAREAGRLVGVVPATIRQWVSRGLLAPIGRHEGANRYDWRDVQRAQDQAKARAPRTAGDRMAKGQEASELWCRVEPRIMDKLVTGPNAARLAKVAPSTIRMWVKRGHLQPAVPGPRPLFRVADVLNTRRRRTPPKNLNA